MFITQYNNFLQFINLYVARFCSNPIHKGGRGHGVGSGSTVIQHKGGRGHGVGSGSTVIQLYYLKIMQVKGCKKIQSYKTSQVGGRASQVGVIT